jgi:hypothetical protein
MHDGAVPVIHAHSHSHDHHHDHDDRDLVEAAFVEGFRHTDDKANFLRLARIPVELTLDGAPYHLVRVRLEDDWEVGAVSRAFSAPSLAYHPLPGKMIAATPTLRFVYVSAADRRELSFAEVMDRA